MVDSTNFENDIAIIGMAGRFPGARTLDQFWQNLHNGVESIAFFSDAELLAAGGAPELLREPNYVRGRGALHDIESFDASFFEYSPKEAALMDPQQRIFLEVAWEALEHASYTSHGYDGAIGVYAGSSTSSYLWSNLYPHRDSSARLDSQQLIVLGNDKDFLATRTSHKLNLSGPSMTVQTACSTSLVAVHLACQGLLNLECDIALAGGISIAVPQQAGYVFYEGGVHSPDGHCRAFDAQARGTVSGSGVGVIVLKRMTDALEDGDTIHAVIKGTAINNDGAQKVSFTAPNVYAQAAVIVEAQRIARVAAETISYVEAHGTGTPLGDPIEIAALTSAFQVSTQRRGFCAIGSVKTNIGHLDAAAGIAGLIKTILALKHRQIPASLHFETPNPNIDFASSPFYVNTRLAEWSAASHPRRAGVSSFGVGGTNVHVILEEAPERRPAGPPGQPWHLLVLSARTGTALETMATNLGTYLRQHPEQPIADAAYTLQVGRASFMYRAMLVCYDAKEASLVLEGRDPRRLVTAVCGAQTPTIAFMFPGQGAQYVRMAADLYEVYPLFRRWIDRCAELLKPHLGLDLRMVLYPDERRTTNDERRMTTDKETRRQGDKETRRQGEGEAETQHSTLNTQHFSSILDQTQYAQPALFAIEYALAQLWMAWGVRPSAMIGHSIGEYVAACLAGVLELEEALALVSARGQLMQQLPGGAMLAVELPERDLLPLLDGGVSLAAVNSPSLSVVSGSTDDVAALAQLLAQRGVRYQYLHTSHAFHSTMMEPIAAPFMQHIARIRLRPPQLPYLSNVTGTWITDQEATDPSYWVRHLRLPVRFDSGMQELLPQASILLEVGPGRTLSTLARQQRAQADGTTILMSLRHPTDRRSDVELLLETLGSLWLAGARVNWSAYQHRAGRRQPLPTYPFERQRYWIEPPGQHSAPLAQHQAGAQRRSWEAWCSVPVWRQSYPPRPLAPRQAALETRRWLIFADEDGLGATLARRLEQQGHSVTTVLPRERFNRLSTQVYALRPRQPADYLALIDDLRARDWRPQIIAHLWSLAPPQGPLTPESFEIAQERGSASLVFLAQAIGKHWATEAIQLAVVSDRAHMVVGDEAVRCEHATLLGLCRVLPQEYPYITCYSIDIALPMPDQGQEARLIAALIAEMTAPSSDRVVAYRYNQRWVQVFEPLQLDLPEAAPQLRRRGVYLITGGLGRIGLTLATYLAQTFQARLVLIGHSAFPPKEAWTEWLAEHGEQDVVSQKILTLRSLEAHGADILVVRADVADRAQMQRAIDQIDRHFGGLHGVIHAAGYVGADAQCAIEELDREEMRRHFQPKIHGLLVLHEALRGRSLDCFLLCSSLSTIVGGLGYAAYAAANAAMDAFAQLQNRGHALPYISVNWDGWQFDQRSETPGSASGTAFLVTPQEGVEVLRHVLAIEALPQVVVSTGDLKVRADQRIGAMLGRGSNNGHVQHARPRQAPAYVAPESPVEQGIAAIWLELLGIDMIGIHDNFFELGGHSLMAGQLVARLRNMFPVDIPIRSIFEKPTLGELAETIEDLLLDKIEALSEESA